MTERPQLFWGMIASMWVGNLMLVILNLPLIGMWIKLLEIPYRMLFPAILLFCGIGVFSLQNSAFDVMMTALFGVFGYVCLKLEAEPAPLMLGFILGPLMEENLRRAMLLSRGDPLVFFQRPISATMLVIALIMLAIIALPMFGDYFTNTYLTGGSTRTEMIGNQIEHYLMGTTQPQTGASLVLVLMVFLLLG